jgi:hypothetical protein
MSEKENASCSSKKERGWWGGEREREKGARERGSEGMERGGGGIPLQYLPEGIASNFLSLFFCLSEPPYAY